MSLDSEDTDFGESDVSLLQIIGEGMSEATSEGFKKFGEETLTPLLINTIAAPIAGPLAAGAAALLGSFAKQLLKETNSIERRLNKLLAQPFNTASRTVREILSEEVRDAAEGSRATERLKRAAELLDEAYTYAESESPRRRLLVRVYQSLVAALIEGGGAALRRYTDELRQLAGRARQEAEHQRTDASRTRERDPAIVREIYEWHGKFAGIAPGIPPHLREAGFRPMLPRSHLSDILRARAEGDIARAEQYEANAQSLERLCTLFENVHQHRQEILRAGKQSDVRKRLRDWLGF
jgi:hypothetical protein